ncbi:hypothetical protein H0H92_010626, partial [Tricholoma furcatifolium]
MQEQKGDLPWAPFTSQKDWELAHWLMTSGASQSKIDSFLKLQMIREDAHPSFHNVQSLLKKIDILPRGPEWICDVFEITGNLEDVEGKKLTQQVELWRRDPIKCIAELLEDPLIGENNAYKPCRVFRKSAGKRVREYSQANTSDRWWELQKKLPPGATVVPVILSSDKTSLTNFSGDKQAYPVYAAIGTTEFEIRRQPSKHAMTLIGYIPVSKLECFSPERRSIEGYQLFHDCMYKILEPLIQAGKDGVRMKCADGFIRMAYLILTAYIADYPEQCLVVGCKENSCPICTVDPKKRGQPIHSVLRDPERTLHVLRQNHRGINLKEFAAQSLRPINPFWRDLPHCNIFSCITPDVLHQLHKGVFKDHIVSWATAAIEGGATEIDRRFRTMTPHSTLRHFKKGISLTTQWTGTEHKNMEKVFLGVLANATDPK